MQEASPGSHRTPVHRRPEPSPPRCFGFESSSWSLPTAHEFELDLCLSDGGVERRLPDPRRRADAVRVEQFENPALSGLITDLCDALDLIRTRDRGRAITVSRRASPEDDGPKC